jgi:hypothetical protein
MEKIEKDKIIEKVGDIKNEFKNKVLGYIMTAFGLVVGLAWNEAIKEMIDLLFPLEQNSIWAKFLYALLLTILIIIITKYLFSETKKENE